MARDIEGPTGDPQLLETSSARRLRVRAAAFVAMLLPTVILAFFHWDLPSLGAYHDDGVYLVTAKAIAEGKGYRIESLPDERWQTKYPPIYPLALAAVWRLSPRFPGNATGFLMVAWLALPVLLLLQARMLANLEFRLASQVVACLCILAYQGVLLLSVTLLSDLWFCCEVLVTIWLAERASELDAHWKFSVAAGLAAALAYLTKSSGIVLFASIAGVMVLKGRWRNALVFCAVSVPAVAIWSAWSFTHLHSVADYNDIFYSSYLQEFAHKNAFVGLLPRFAARASEFLLRLGGAVIPEFLSGVAFDWLRRLAGILGVVGVVRLCRLGKAWHYAAFAALYAFQMCVWPSPLFPRYVLPAVPLWIAGLLTLPQYYRPGAGDSQQPKKVPLWGPLATGLLACAYFFQCVSGIHTAVAWRSERRVLERAYAWIAQNTPPTASVVAFRDPLLYLYTGRHAEGLHSSGGPDGVSRILHIAEFARRRGHRYVLIGPRDPEFDANLTRAAISTALQADGACRPVFSADGADIYDVTAR
jgi:hypothetical protein